MPLTLVTQYNSNKIQGLLANEDKKQCLNSLKNNEFHFQPTGWKLHPHSKEAGQQNLLLPSRSQPQKEMWAKAGKEKHPPPSLLTPWPSLKTQLTVLAEFSITLYKFKRENHTLKKCGTSHMINVGNYSYDLQKQPSPNTNNMHLHYTN